MQRRKRRCESRGLAGQATGFGEPGGGGRSFVAAGRSEVFDRRTPEHVLLAGMIGLGEFDLAKLSHKRIHLG